MGIITISRGSYTRGKEIAEKTARTLGYDCVSREVLLRSSKDFDIPEIKLIQAVDDAPSILDRFTYGKEKYIAYIRNALLNQLKKDNVVYHGFVYHSFVKDIVQILNVRIISGMEDRLRIVMERDNVSRKEALRVINRIDAQRRKWGRRLYGIDPGDPRLYDLVLNIEKITADDAVVTICRFARLSQFQTTPEFKGLLQDMALAAEVTQFLVGVKPSVEVTVEDGMVALKTKAPLTRESPLQGKIGEIMKIQGVKEVRVVPEEHPDEQYARVTRPRAKSMDETLPTYFTELG
jgi:cytidylate kinase